MKLHRSKCRDATFVPKHDLVLVHAGFALVRAWPWCYAIWTFTLIHIRYLYLIIKQIGVDVMPPNCSAYHNDITPGCPWTSIRAKKQISAQLYSAARPETQLTWTTNEVEEEQWFSYTKRESPPLSVDPTDPLRAFARCYQLRTSRCLKMIILLVRLTVRKSSTKEVALAFSSNDRFKCWPQKSSYRTCKCAPVSTQLQYRIRICSPFALMPNIIHYEQLQKLPTRIIMEL